MSNNVERFQDFCRKFINRKVREHFNDLGGEDWEPDFNVSRHFTRWVCTHQDADPMMLTLGRLLVYFFKVQGFLDEPIYAMPYTQLYRTVQTLPQIIIKFQESAEDARQNKRSRIPLRAIHYVRIAQHFETEADVERIARKVREIFATPVFHFNKGRIKYTYADRKRGLLYIVACPNESEAKSVIEKLLALIDVVPDWQLLTDSHSRKNFTETERVRINSKVYKKPPSRPLGKVYFMSAELHVHGLPGNIHLIDLGGRSSKTVLSA